MRIQMCAIRHVGVTQEFVALRTVRFLIEEDQNVLGGAQKIDGFRASMRRYVEKKSINTGDTETAKRDWLNHIVSALQRHLWKLKSERLRLFGELFAKHWDDALDACPEFSESSNK